MPKRPNEVEAEALRAMVKAEEDEYAVDSNDESEDESEDEEEEEVFYATREGAKAEEASPVHHPAFHAHKCAIVYSYGGLVAQGSGLYARA